MRRAASLLSVLLLPACAADSESTAAEPSSIATTATIVADPPPPPALSVPTPEDPLARELWRATSLGDAVDVLQGHFGDESNQTAFAMRTVKSPPGADLLEEWLSRNTVSDAELWRAPLARGGAAGLAALPKGTQLCVHVARYARAQHDEPFSLLAMRVGRTEESEEDDPDFYLRVMASLPERLPAHFCGVYTGLLIENRWSAPKIVGRFVGPRPGLTPHPP